MVKLALHELWSRKRRLMGMFSAILIGVAFLAGTLVLGDTMRSGFGNLFAEANAGTDAVVRSATRLSSGDDRTERPARRVARREVRGTDGVADAEVSVQGLGPDRRRRRRADRRQRPADPRGQLDRRHER